MSSKDGVDFAMLLALRAPRLRSVGKAGELQILCCQGFEVNDYNFTLDALALKPSGFCNVRVCYDLELLIYQTIVKENA